MGTTLWASSPVIGRPVGVRPRYADQRQASQYVTPTRATNPNSPQVAQTSGGNDDRCTLGNHHVAAVIPSNAVDPSRTATIAAVPGTEGMPASPSNGSRKTSWPSARRPNGETRA